ncbi:hypothetical protein DFJ74DRAFT_291449 [Hyaloraphidium curvatum]|nr:hypothetical protein DFJ74DRAFT_291449 [Hyaloraphidium curvatum]
MGAAKLVVRCGRRKPVTTDVRRPAAVEDVAASAVEAFRKAHPEVAVCGRQPLRIYTKFLLLDPGKPLGTYLKARDGEILYPDRCGGKLEVVEDGKGATHIVRSLTAKAHRLFVSDVSQDFLDVAAAMDSPLEIELEEILHHEPPQGVRTSPQQINLLVRSLNGKVVKIRPWTSDTIGRVKPHPGRRGHYARSAAPVLRGQAARGPTHARRLQRSAELDFAPCAPAAVPRHDRDPCEQEHGDLGQNTDGQNHPLESRVHGHDQRPEDKDPRERGHSA